MQIITNLTNLLSHTENANNHLHANNQVNGSDQKEISEITYVGNTPAPYIEDDGLIAW
jgi:hypothetical protein